MQITKLSFFSSCALAVSASLFSSQASAVITGPTIVGFNMYGATSTGASNNDPIPGAFRWSSNSSDQSGVAREAVTPTSPSGAAQTLGVSFALSPGLNSFSFAPNPSYPPGGTANPGSYAGIELFLNATGTSFNPSGDGNPANLAAFVPTNNSAATLTYPANGTEIVDYGPGVNIIAYDGASSFTVGGDVITFTQMSITTADTGSFTISVAPVPEPASLLLASVGGCMLLCRRPRIGSSG